MLVLLRKRNETIVINDDITIDGLEYPWVPRFPSLPCRRSHGWRFTRRFREMDRGG